MNFKHILVLVGLSLVAVMAIMGGLVYYYVTQNSNMPQTANTVDSTTITQTSVTATPAPEVSPSLTPSSSPAAAVATKVYKNTDFHFTLDYPATWSVDAPNGVDPATAPAILSAPCNFDAGQTCLTVYMEYGEDTGGRSLENYVNDQLALNNLQTATKTNTTLAGLPAIRVVAHGESNSYTGAMRYQILTYTIRNNQTFVIKGIEETKTSYAASIKDFQNPTAYDALVGSIKFN